MVARSSQPHAMKNIRSIRYSLLAIAALGPWLLRRVILKWLCDASFGDNARVGRSFVDVDRLVMGANASIGSLNVFWFFAEFSG